MMVTVPSSLCARFSPSFAIEDDFVVLADVGDDGIDVGLRVAEDEGADDDVRCLSRGDAIK